MNLLEQNPDVIPHIEAIRDYAIDRAAHASKQLARLAIETSGQLQLDLYPELEAA